MKNKFNFIANVVIGFMMLFSYVSCDNDDVTDDKGVVQSVSADKSYGKKYRVEVKIGSKWGVLRYTLYTDKSYRVGDSIFIK